MRGKRILNRKRVILIAAAVAILAVGIIYISGHVRLRRLIRDLDDPNVNVRAAAIVALAADGSPRVIKALIPPAAAIDHETPRGSLPAKAALVGIGAKTVGALLKASRSPKENWFYKLLDKATGRDPQERSTRAEMIRPFAQYFLANSLVPALGEKGIETLRPFLKDKDPEIRRLALWSLPDTAFALELVTPMLKDKDADVRAWAVAKIATIGGPDATELLITLLQDADPKIRRGAAWWLAELREPAAVEPLLLEARAGGRDAPVATRLLGKIADETAPVALLAILNDNTCGDGVRFTAAATLGKIGERRAVADLMRYIRDDKCPIRAGVANALGIFRHADAVPQLLAMLESKNEGELAHASRALGRIGDARAVEPILLLYEKLNRPRLPEEELESATEVPLGNSLSRPWWVEAYVIEALGLLRDPRALPPLLDAIKAGAYSMYEIKAVSRIGGEVAFEALFAMAEDADNDYWVEAIVGLGILGDERAVAVLVDILKEDYSHGYEESFRLWGYEEVRAEEILDDLADEPAETISVATRALAFYNRTVREESKESYYDSDSFEMKVVVALEMIGTKEARSAVDAYLVDDDIDRMGREYRQLISKADRDFIGLCKIVLERHGDIEMAEDFYWSRDANLRYVAVDWAERHGLLDELEAAKDSLERPQLGIDNGQ